MGRYAQLVLGPAGSGKSTYCSFLQKHCDTVGRTIHVVNLDPAADSLPYTPVADVRDLVSLSDVADELELGPNGGLVFCLEYLSQNLEWLEEALGDHNDDYLVIDCPGQIELFTHLPALQIIAKHLVSLDYHVCAVYLLDSTFVTETSKLMSGLLTCLSAMIRLEMPHVSLLSKVDLLKKAGLGAWVESLGESSMEELISNLTMETGSRLASLNKAVGTLVDEYGMVSFIPLDLREEDGILEPLTMIDAALQYGEDEEPVEPDDEVEFDEGDGDGGGFEFF